MKVIDHLQEAKRPLISFEIIPPLRGGDLASLLGLMETLAKYRPPFIDITSHAAEVVYDETPGGYQKRIKRKRPGTLGVCALIQKKFEIDAVPHLLCEGFTTQETEDFLIELHYLGIDNVLAIRGDGHGYQKPLEHGRTRNEHATDLIAQIQDMNKGVYLEDLLDAYPTDFCIGAAGYPEKHFEAPNLASDIAWVKRKVEAGAEYIVTQMFFDNRRYFSFVEECRRHGIDVPIIPGLKILTTRQQLTSLPRTFHCDIPEELAEAVGRADEGEVTETGVNWTMQQMHDLMDAGVAAIHVYVMQRSRAIQMLMDRLDIPDGL
ncbi:MAG: methylenetetrahydrofolate reductase [Acidimicrobiia bacterium]|nr:methylenetetrahydrofolate reductase [Acidimicrobiia bacterium]